MVKHNEEDFGEEGRDVECRKFNGKEKGEIVWICAQIIISISGLLWENINASRIICALTFCILGLTECV